MVSIFSRQIMQRTPPSFFTHSLQQTACPQGMKAMQTFASRHTLHSGSCSNDIVVVDECFTTLGAFCPSSCAGDCDDPRRLLISRMLMVSAEELTRSKYWSWRRLCFCLILQPSTLFSTNIFQPSVVMFTFSPICKTHILVKNSLENITRLAIFCLSANFQQNYYVVEFEQCLL